MISNTNRRIEEHNENEGKAWGGYVEDQMAYAMARLRTGQRDPEWVRRYQMLQSVKEFFERVANAIAADIEAKKKPSKPAPAPTSEPQDASNATIEALKRMADDLKTRVQKGEISAARAAEYTELLHNLKDFGAQSMEQLDRAAILEKARGLFSRFEQNYADPSGSGRIPEQARLAGADRIDRYVQEMKRFLLREAQNLPPEHTLRETTTLMGELSQMQQTLAAAQTEADVLTMTTCEIKGKSRADIEALKESVDAALYGITVSTHDSSLEASLAFFQREMAEHPKRAVFEKSGWLSDELNRDPVAMTGALRQMIRQTSGRQWEILVVGSFENPA